MNNMNDEIVILNNKFNSLQKHVNCLYELADIVEASETDIDEILSRITDTLLSALDRPEILSIELEYDDNLFRSRNYRSSRNILEFKISMRNFSDGTLRIIFQPTHQKQMEQTLTIEEKNLISYLCERIGRIIQRHKLTADLEETRKIITINNKMLENKNIALKEILNLLEAEKLKNKLNIQKNIDTIISPILKKMKSSNSPSKYYSILDESIKNLISPISNSSHKEFQNLTNREKEICFQIQNGLASKEISDLLSVSEQTINKHRSNIRKKLGIRNEKQNLRSFLDSLR